jgi:hypothetical protein
MNGRRCFITGNIVRPLMLYEACLPAYRPADAPYPVRKAVSAKPDLPDISINNPGNITTKEVFSVLFISVLLG